MSMTEQDSGSRCPKCAEPVTDKVIKALGKIYHQECFTCHDCGDICKSKYFPFKLPDSDELVPLCQLDYFKRNNLLCFVCNNPLKGTFFNAFGKLYDEEHFCCTICKEKCSMQECFNYEDKLYCKFHYLKFFSKRCKGCQYPITDQHFEFPRGDKIYRWHPECYGIHRYWHIDLNPESLGLPSIPLVTFSEQTNRDTNPSPAQMNKFIEVSENLTFKTWSTLYKFEEETAGCISDMLRYLTSEDKTKGIKSAALFVLKIECLFKALDSLSSINDYSISTSQVTSPEAEDGLAAPEPNTDVTDSRAQKYKKFPKNLSSKIMIYLQLLRKSSLQADDNAMTVSKVMSIINGLSHYLKLLIRYGLYNALEYNKKSHSTNALMKFLREINRNLSFPPNSEPFDYIMDIPIDSTDCCVECEKYIQQECIKFQENKRWHLSCFQCSECRKGIKKYDILDSTYNKKTQRVFCPLCSMTDPESQTGFKPVTKLMQLTYLLKVALVKTKTVMNIQMKTQQPPSVESRANSISQEQSYIRTVNDIKSLRAKRNSLKISRETTGIRQSSVTRQNFIESSKTKETVNIDEFNNSKALTLDDISRIVAMEEAKELNKRRDISKSKSYNLNKNVANLTLSLGESPAASHELSDVTKGFRHFNKVTGTTPSPNTSGVYYSDLSIDHLYKIQLIALSILQTSNFPIDNIDGILSMLKKNSQPQISSPHSTTKFWSKSKTSKKLKTSSESNQVFNIPLYVLTEAAGIDSDLGMGYNRVRIPLLLDELISAMKQMDMSVEGLFRKNGNIKKLRRLTEEINENPTSVPDFSNENAIQLSALLKKFFRDLPDPLLTKELYKNWLKLPVKHADLKMDFILFYTLLPKHNRNVSEVLFSFLKWVSTFANIENPASNSGSKMDIRNLATVFTPNILYSMAYAPVRGSTDFQNDENGNASDKDYMLAIEVVNYLTLHIDEMSMVPMFLMKLLNQINEERLSTYEQLHTYVIRNYKSINFSEF